MRVSEHAERRQGRVAARWTAMQALVREAGEAKREAKGKQAPARARDKVLLESATEAGKSRPRSTPRMT